MSWQLNEINNLIWPSPNGIGVMDADAWAQTVQVSVDGGVIAEPASDDAYRTDLAEAALELLDGDLMGENYKPAEVELVAGGE